MLVATEHFRRDITPHCSDFSENVVDRFITIFRRNTPIVQRFTERKFEMILREQDGDLEEKEAQLERAAQDRLMLELEVTKLRNFVGQCTQMSETLAAEVQRQFLSQRFVNDELRNLDTLKSHLQGVDGCQQMHGFYGNMQVLLTYLLKSTGKHLQDNHQKVGEDGVRSEQETPRRRQTARRVQDKLQLVVDKIVNLIDDNCSDPDKHDWSLRTRLENILEKFSEVADDVLQVQHTLQLSLRERRRFERETLSLLHSVQEMQRLQREVTEKQHHLIELSQQGQTMKRKTKHHRKQLQQIDQTMKTKRLELTELQGTLAEQSQSADRSMHMLLQLLPDLQDEVSYVTLTSGTTQSLGSRTATQMSIASNSDRQEVLPVGNRTCLTNLPKLQDSGVILEINHNHHLDQSVINALQTDHNSKSSVPTTTDTRNTTTVSSEIERWLAEQQAKSAVQDKAEAHSQEEKSARQIITKGHPHEANSDGQIMSKGHPHEAKSDGKVMAKIHLPEATSAREDMALPRSQETKSIRHVMTKAQPQEAKSTEQIMAKRHPERDITVNMPPTIYHNDTVRIKTPMAHEQPPTPTPQNSCLSLSRPTDELPRQPKHIEHRAETLNDDIQGGTVINEKTETRTIRGSSTQPPHGYPTDVPRNKGRSLREPKTSTTRHPPPDDSTGDSTPNKMLHRRHLSRQTLAANKIQLRMPSQ